MSRARALGGACVVIGVLAVAGCAITSDATGAAAPASVTASSGATTAAAYATAGAPEPAPTSSSGVSGTALCDEGTPVTVDGDEVGGFEGWWNSTPADADGNDADPSTWPKEMLEHPATAQVVAATGHVLEVCDRGTGFDAATYRAPQDRRGWPRHGVVLLDARTGKLLEVLGSGSAGA